MRSIKELLEILLEKVEKQSTIWSGLCAEIIELRIFNEISYKEQQLIKKYIKEHRPFNWRNRIEQRAYHWYYGLIKPRVK